MGTVEEMVTVEGVLVDVELMEMDIMAGLTEVMEGVPPVVAARGRTSPPTPSVPGPSHLGRVDGIITIPTTMNTMEVEAGVSSSRELGRMEVSIRGRDMGVEPVDIERVSLAMVSRV